MPPPVEEPSAEAPVEIEAPPPAEVPSEEIEAPAKPHGHGLCKVLPPYDN